MRRMLKQIPLGTAGKYGILKDSYFDVITSETDAEIVVDASVEEEDALKWYMNYLFEALADVKTMLSERKDENFSITDENGFAGIDSSEDFDYLSMATWHTWQTIGPILRRTKISSIQIYM